MRLSTIIACLMLLAVGCRDFQTSNRSGLPLRYRNAKYGLTIYLPASWQGYSVVIGEWDGYPEQVEHGPIISLRNPRWKPSDQYQDIPIMVFTRKQWDDEEQGKFFPYAGGVIFEMWHNDRYVFGNYSRYSWYELKGWQDTERIIQQNCDAHKMAHLYPH